MILAFDIGNTNIVIGVMEQNNIRYTFRLQSEVSRTVDEYAISVFDLLRHHNVDIKEISGVVISSVVPQLTTSINAVIKKYFKMKPIIVSQELDHGLKIMLDNPKELGSDRLMSALAAHTIYKKNCITVDFGTATTMEVVTANGEFLGGTIFPGVTLAVKALHINTAKLPMVDISMPSKVLGKNTIHSIQSGIFYGYLAMVDGMIDKILSEVFKNNEEVLFIGTGGMGTAFAKETKHNMIYEPNLILYGLYYLYQRVYGTMMS